MNNIEKKLGHFMADKSLFVHRNEDAALLIQKQLGVDGLIPIHVHDQEYLIEKKPMTASMTQRNDYSVAVKLQQGLWALSTVSLFEWEWLYLTQGLFGVNQHRFYQGKDANGATTLITEKSLQDEIELWKDLVLNNEADEAMLTIFKQSYYPVRLSEQVEWVPVA
ncbi:hypothetical protein EXA21_14155 [Vibrio cincinnatiensis]|uniref:hypothetical protein n=1 Tax=Vibrio cincinnatiensis TaxID=675 RepID=UPI001EDDBF88|nr:hypothetical protein [Vibrio cincinnatiensis]MCG3760659.1 hypothetical protein [Vibrio cincinnatiensis]MCG3763964.1 hypothetical protein [Vibrio cincinnatiensis]